MLFLNRHTFIKYRPNQAQYVHVRLIKPNMCMCVCTIVHTFIIVLVSTYVCMRNYVPMMNLSVPFCPFHFVRTISFPTILVDFGRYNDWYNSTRVPMSACVTMFIMYAPIYRYIRVRMDFRQTSLTSSE